MAVQTFLPVDRSTPFFLPPSVQEWVPSDHLAYFIVDVVDQLDLSALERSYAGRGSKAYHPGMLLSLLFYGYATGIFSSRKLEAATHDSIAFRFICANMHPDHDTIATFRRRFLEHLEGYFIQILELAHEMQMLQVGTVSLDGSKMKANASKHKALSWGHAMRLEARLKKEVELLFEEAERTDREEEDASVHIPEELRHRQERIAAIGRAKAKIEARAAARHEEEKKAYEAKMDARKQREEGSGSKVRGRAPQPPVEGPKEKDQINLTDEESRIMPTGGGRFEQAYNVQAGVDTASHLIVTQFVTQACNDKQQIVPALEYLNALPEHVGRARELLADNGYMSEANVEAISQAGIEALIATGREAHHRPLHEQLEKPGAPDPEASPLEKMRYRLGTHAGRALYAKRKCTVEPVFGQIKRAMGFREFMLRGFKKTSGEWTLVATAYNLRRMNQLRMKGALRPTFALG